VYIAARSERKIDAAISSLRKECPGSKGDLKPLILDLSDLTTIKPAAKRFLAQQNRLHVLVHNAGVMMPPKGSRDRQVYSLLAVGHEVKC
jgi:retinol dehydrogenase-12